MRQKRSKFPEPRGVARKARCSASLVAALVCGVIFSGPPAPAAQLDDALGTEVRTNKDSASSQKKIDVIAEDVETLTADYRATLQAARSLDIYNRQLESLIASQEREVESLERQIDQVTVVGREIMPLMSRMIDSLEQFVELDMPFLQEERANRVAGLREMMDRADVTISEKYRRLMEALQIENDYGRNIEAYSGELESGGQTRTVDFLRVGRLALLYQTLDGQETGTWDQEAGGWVQLGDDYRKPVTQGLRMARKEVAPDLIRIPAPAAQVQQ
jgi:hypothetical protein